MEPVFPKIYENFVLNCCLVIIITTPILSHADVIEMVRMKWIWNQSCRWHRWSSYRKRGYYDDKECTSLFRC